MSTAMSRKQSFRRFLGAAAILTLAGCDFLAGALDTYKGPTPDRQPLTAERVVVRGTIPSSGDLDKVGGYYFDRLRYLESNDPHNVNRVVHVSSGERREDAWALGIRVGDTLVVSTRYDATYHSGAPTSVPNWPGHGYVEYPIAYHTLTAVSR